MVVLRRGAENPISGECHSKRCSGVHAGARVVDLSHGHLLACVRALSTHLSPADSKTTGLHQGVPRGIRCGNCAAGAFEDQEADDDHQP